MDLVSSSELRNESTAETPSAFRKAVFGLSPLAVLSERPPACEVLPASVVRKLLLLRIEVVSGLLVVVELRPPGVLAVLVVKVPVVCDVLLTVPPVRPFPAVICWAARVPPSQFPWPC